MADLSNPFEQRYKATMEKYHDYFDGVRSAFKQHCDEIKAETFKKLDAVAEDDKEGRKKILMEQKEELDKTLAELKQLIGFQTRKMRESLETIRKEQDEQSFNLEAELSSIAA